MLQSQVTSIELHLIYILFLLVPLNSRLMLFNSAAPGRRVQGYSSGRQLSADLDPVLSLSLCSNLQQLSVLPLLGNTGMQAHCKSSFYLKAALHASGHKLSSLIHHPCWTAIAGFIKNYFSMIDSIEGKQCVMQRKPHTAT